MQFGSENDDQIKWAVFFNSQDETEIISKLLPIPRFKEIAAMVEILTESIIQTKDEWIQQYLLNRAPQRLQLLRTAHSIVISVF